MKKLTYNISRDSEGIRINGNLIEIVVYHSGICVIKNFSTGGGHSAYPNIDITGSIRGMKKNRNWGKNDKIVRSGGFYYNTSIVSIHDDLDSLAYWFEQNGTNAFYKAIHDGKKTFTIEI